MSNHTAMTGAIAAQRYQELSLRLQQEYYQSLPKSSVDHLSSLESSMPKLKEHRSTRLRSALVMTDNVPKSRASSISSSGSQRDPTVPFRSTMDRSSRCEEMGLALVNVTYKGSDKVASWRHSVMETTEGTTRTGVTQISFSLLLLPFTVLFLYFLFCETISWSEKGVCKGRISTLCDPLGSLPYSVVCVFGITLSDANIIPFTMFT